MIPKLGVNIDHVATLRQQRLPAGRQAAKGFPDPIQAALIAQANGADSIVAHLREDRRHIQDGDLNRLKKALKVPLAMEMAATPEMVAIAGRVRPARACLVPEKRQELTTEGGLNLLRHSARLKAHIDTLVRRGVEVSLFIDAEPRQVRAAKALGASIIELHTGRYAQAHGPARVNALRDLRTASRLAQSLELRLHAGHGLDESNVRPVAQLPGMEELNIGFSIIARAVFDGLARSVRGMKRAMHGL